MIAIDSRKQNELALAMHYAVVVPDAPIANSPLFAFTGDIGPLADFHMVFGDNGDAVLADNGEPLVIDVPLGCFSDYINDQQRTAHVSVYVLTTAETLEFLESSFLAKP